MEITDEQIAAKDEAQIKLLEMPGVTGVGIGMAEENGELFEEDLAIRVYVENGEEVPGGIPPQIEGIPVCVVELVLEPYAEDLTRYDTLKGGIRIGHPSFGGSTMASVVKEIREDGEEVYYGLAAKHGVGTGIDQWGNPEIFPHCVWQPIEKGSIVGVPLPPGDDAVGLVMNAVFPEPIPLVGGAEFAPADAAIFDFTFAAENGREISPAIVGQEPEEELIGAVTETALPDIPQLVRKRGFVTRVTHGLVIDLHATVWWEPGGSNTYLGEQFLIQGIPSSDNPSGVFAKPGDSGSLILDEGSPTAIGLLYGANKKLAFMDAGKRVAASRIRNVELALGVTPVW
jgi:hypothetical protein